MPRTVDQRILDCVVEVLQVDPSEVTPEARFEEDLGASSLTIVEVIMALEETFDVKVPEEAMEDVKTVADACLVIERLQ
jgi:acyl carrier protein